MLVLIFIKRKGRLKYPRVVFLFLAYMILILFHILANVSIFFHLQVAVKEVYRLCTYILVTLAVANAPIREKHFIKIWNMLFVFIVLIAISQFNNLTIINTILERVYGESIFIEITKKYSKLKHFRTGSIFINPNSFAKFILFYLGLFLSINMKIGTEKVKSFFLIVIISALILAGSRTGFVISMIMVMYMLIVDPNLRKRFIRIFPFIGIIIIVLMNNYAFDFDNFRLFKVG